MEKLQLYVDNCFLSPYAMSAFVALSEKGVAFEIVPINLSTGGTRTPAYARASLTQRVPMLVHGEFSLSESSAIGEYLDEVFPGTPLYPRGIRERAQARQIQAWLRSDLLPIRQERSTEIVFLGVTKAAPLSEAAREAVEHLFFVAELLLDDSSRHLFTTFSLADVDLALMLNRLVFNGDRVPERLVAYARRQWQRPAVQLWLNQRRTV